MDALTLEDLTHDVQGDRVERTSGSVVVELHDGRARVFGDGRLDATASNQQRRSGEPEPR